MTQLECGEPTLAWRVRHQILSFYEVDLDAIAALVPPALELVEIRPGIALIALECLHYGAGHFDEPGEAVEVVFAALVQPDLSVAMPVPRFSMFVISVISSSAAFVTNESRVLGSPLVHVPDLRIEFSADGASADIFDGDTPIASCRSTHDTALAYEHKVLWGLTYTNTRGLERGVFRWEGDVVEHMKRGAWGSIEPHPFFKGLDPRRIRGCYRQMVARPDAIDIRYFHLTRESPDTR